MNFLQYSLLWDIRFFKPVFNLQKNNPTKVLQIGFEVLFYFEI